MRPQYLIKLAGLDELKPLVTDATGKKIVPQKAVDTALSFGSGAWKGPNLKWNLLGNGYVHSMLPSTLIGAGVGGLISLLSGKGFLRGLGIGGLAGAGLGALHQYMYDTNKDYAFKNPFTKFTEWLTVPKDKDGSVSVSLGGNTSVKLPYNAFRDYLYNTKNDVGAETVGNVNNLIRGANMLRRLGKNPHKLRVLPNVSIPADKVRPHHLYYPLGILPRVMNK